MIFLESCNLDFQFRLSAHIFLQWFLTNTSMFTVVLPFTRFLKEDFSKFVLANHVKKKHIPFCSIDDTVFLSSLFKIQKSSFEIFFVRYLFLYNQSLPCQNKSKKKNTYSKPLIHTYSIYYLHLPLRKLNQNWCQICKHLLSWDKHKHTNCYCFDMPVNCVTLPTFERLKRQKGSLPIDTFFIYTGSYNCTSRNLSIKWQ